MKMGIKTIFWVIDGPVHCSGNISSINSADWIGCYAEIISRPVHFIYRV